MSTKTGKRSSQRNGSTRKRTSRRGRSSRRGRDSSLLWIVAIPVALVAVLVLNAWQSGAFAAAPDTSRVGDPASLPPLSEAGSVLRGGHDMALIPERTPTPQAPPVEGPSPLFAMPARSHDFGQIYESWDVTHVFVVENNGDADLVIGNLVTSCGCTTAELSSSIIPPGERADLKVVFDANFHPTSGEVTRLVWFATNDPTQPWIEVRVSADVR
jgi:hypothetical protein